MHTPKKTAETDLMLQAWVVETEEIIEAWPKIEPTVRAGLMVIVRTQKDISIRL